MVSLIRNDNEEEFEEDPVDLDGYNHEIEMEKIAYEWFKDNDITAELTRK